MIKGILFGPGWPPGGSGRGGRVLYWSLWMWLRKTRIYDHFIISCSYCIEMISNTGSSLQTDTRILESKQNPDKCNVTTSDKVLFLLLNSQVKYHLLTIVGSKEVSFRISRGHPGLSGSGHAGARWSQQARTTKGASVYLSLGLLIPSWRAIARDRGARTGDGLCFDLRAVSLMDGSRNTQSKDHQNCCLPWNNSKKTKEQKPTNTSSDKNETQCSPRVTWSR